MRGEQTIRLFRRMVRVELDFGASGTNSGCVLVGRTDSSWALRRRNGVASSSLYFQRKRLVTLAVGVQPSPSSVEAAGLGVCPAWPRCAEGGERRDLPKKFPPSRADRQKRHGKEEMRRSGADESPGASRRRWVGCSRARLSRGAAARGRRRRTGSAAKVSSFASG